MSEKFSTKLPLIVNPDLQKERYKSSFNVTDLTSIIDGGKEETQKRKQIERIVFSDPDFVQFPIKQSLESLNEYYGSAIFKSTKLFKLRQQYKWTEKEFDMVMRVVGFGHSLIIHDATFVPAIEMLSTEEQKKEWLPAAKQYKIIGCYAQTEMGHGTYLQGLETTATYDPQTQEFILNTPSVSAMKWWPGGLGLSCNHAIVLATLFIQDKNCGMHPFFVQLRSFEDHRPLHGITLGMVGETLGVTGVDNGFLVMDNVRIPRKNMLMRNAQVAPDGKFISKSPDKANYATMVLGRVNICRWCYYYLSMGTTIVVRYSAVRRQSKIDPQQREPQILDYQTQQFKVFPGLALSYALLFTYRSLYRKYETTLREIQVGNFSNLPELHCETAGLKAFCSENATRELEIMRRSCGGHGYLNASGMPAKTASVQAFITLEGEHTVMYLQAARYLVKRYSAALSGEILDGCTAYLNTEPDSFIFPNTSNIDCVHLHTYVQLYQRRAYMMIALAAKLIRRDVDNGMSEHYAINKNQVHLLKASKAHCYYTVVKNFVEAVETLVASPGIIKVMQKLCSFFATHGITEYSGDFLESKTITVDDLKWIKATHVHLLGDIRPDAVSLVDAFDYHDITLSSTIGSYDGNVYERMFKSSEQDPINKEQVHPSYQKYLKPFIKSHL